MENKKIYIEDILNNIIRVQTAIDVLSLSLIQVNIDPSSEDIGTVLSVYSELLEQEIQNLKTHFLSNEANG